MLRCGTLAKMVGLSRMQVYRLARAGEIPNARRTKGGHFTFSKGETLKEWVESRLRNTGSKMEPVLDTTRRLRLPPALRALVLVSRLAKFFRRHPVESFPPGTRAEIQRELRQVVKVVFPEDFGT